MSYPPYETLHPTVLRECYPVTCAGHQGKSFREEAWWFVNNFVKKSYILFGSAKKPDILGLMYNLSVGG